MCSGSDKLKREEDEKELDQLKEEKTAESQPTPAEASYHSSPRASWNFSPEQFCSKEIKFQPHICNFQYSRSHTKKKKSKKRQKESISIIYFI